MEELQIEQKYIKEMKFLWGPECELGLLKEKKHKTKTGPRIPGKNEWEKKKK